MQNLTIARSDTPSRILASFEPAPQKKPIQKTASTQSIRLAEAEKKGFKKLAFDLYENPDYGTLWQLEDVDGEPWLVAYTDDDDNIIRKVASRLATIFQSKYKKGTPVLVGEGAGGTIENIRYVRTGPEYLVRLAEGEELWVKEDEVVPTSENFGQEASVHKILEAVAQRLKTAQPRSPSEDVAPMGFNVATPGGEMPEEEIQQFFSDQEGVEVEKKPPEPPEKEEEEKEVGEEERMEITMPSRTRHIEIDLEGEGGEEVEEEAMPVAAPSGLPGTPGPGLGGEEIPVGF